MTRNMKTDMVYRGFVRNGKIELGEEAQLPEGAEVDITLPDVEAQDDEGAPTLHETLKPFIGAVKELPEDFSINHDHYLYGTPKRE